MNATCLVLSAVLIIQTSAQNVISTKTISSSSTKASAVPTAQQAPSRRVTNVYHAMISARLALKRVAALVPLATVATQTSPSSLETRVSANAFPGLTGIV